MILIRSLVLLAVVAGAPAAAHLVFDQPRGVAAARAVEFLRVSHGCGLSPTLSIRVEIPADVTIVRPQPKPGWTLAIEHAALPAPIAGEGGAIIRERVTAVSWTGSLRADEFDQFGLALTLPARAGPLYFPTVQRCASGPVAWTTIPIAGQPWHAVAHPAPVIDLSPADVTTPAMGMEHH